jgi:hypothetical protein
MRAMFGVFWVALVFVLLSTVVPASAGPLVISGEDPKQEITVVTENSTVDRILQDLAARYGFEIKGIHNVGMGDALSGKMSGNLHDVLSRLLRNWNHMIVRSPDNASGVAKVMILDASYGAAPTPATSDQGAE